MLKLKLQYFGHLMWTADSLEKTLLLGKIEGKRRREWQRMRWLDGVTGLMDMGLSKPWEMMKNRETWRAAVQGVTKSWTRLSNWTMNEQCVWLHQVSFAARWIFTASCRIFPWGSQTLLMAHGLRASGSVVAAKHATSVWGLSSWTRDQTHVPCIARQVLNHWTSREVPPLRGKQQQQQLVKAKQRWLCLSYLQLSLRSQQTAVSCSTIHIWRYHDAICKCYT